MVGGSRIFGVEISIFVSKSENTSAWVAKSNEGQLGHQQACDVKHVVKQNDQPKPSEFCLQM